MLAYIWYELKLPRLQKRLKHERGGQEKGSGRDPALAIPEIPVGELCTQTTTYTLGAISVLKPSPVATFTGE